MRHAWKYVDSCLAIVMLANKKVRIQYASGIYIYKTKMTYIRWIAIGF